MKQLDRQHDGSGPEPNQLALYRIAWFLGLALVMALAAPAPLFAATLSAMLGLASFLLALGASVLREPITAPHLTRWDAAAILYLFGAVFGWFVDRAAVQDFLHANAGG